MGYWLVNANNFELISDNDYYLGVFICICHGITDRDIRTCAEEGACTVRDLERCLGVGSSCGRCKPAAKEILKEAAPSAKLAA